MSQSRLKTQKLYNYFKLKFDPNCFAASLSSVNPRITKDSELKGLIQEFFEISSEKYEPFFPCIFIIAVKRRISSENKIKNVDIKVSQALEECVDTYSVKISREIESTSTIVLCRIIETVKFVGELYSYELIDGKIIHQWATSVLVSEQNAFFQLFLLSIVQCDVLKRADSNFYDMLLQNLIFEVGLCNNADDCGM
jgi:hypothetical protein